MRRPEPIADYLDALARELAFDPPLCRRVCHELEDHLGEMLEAEGGEPTAAGTVRAIERLGSPRAIAEQYRALSLLTRMRASALMLVVAVAGIFLAMKARIAWYGITEWDASAQLQAINAIALPVDRYAFLAATFGALAGWLYAATLPAPATCRADALVALKRCGLLLRIATIFITGAVGIELVLSLYRFADAGLSSALILPAVTIMLEAVFVAAVAISLRNTARRFAILSR
ncbi:MAG: hypothetical protein JO000_23960 [Alphaproteobacteria bacterium]|nr:hypothetical protein [Alphaproteobacteria bacterium]